MKIKPKPILLAPTKNVLRISKGPIESIILLFIDIYYSYRTWVPALISIRLFQFCNPFFSYICDYRPWTSSCYGLSLALTSIKAVSVPKAFSQRKQKEVCRPESPAIVLAFQGAAELHILPPWVHGAFLHGCSSKTGDGDKALWSHSHLAHSSH